MRMKRPADLLGTFVFDHEDSAVSVDVLEPESAEKSALPAAEKGLRPTRLEGTMATESIIIWPTTEATTRQQAERIDQLEAERAANETKIVALTGEVEQLHAALNVVVASSAQHRFQDQPCSWLACAPPCGQGSKEPEPITQTSARPAQPSLDRFRV